MHTYPFCCGMHENPGPKKFGDFLGGYFVGKILRVALWRRRFLAAPAARNIPRRFLEGALSITSINKVSGGSVSLNRVSGGSVLIEYLVAVY